MLIKLFINLPSWNMRWLALTQKFIPKIVSLIFPAFYNICAEYVCCNALCVMKVSYVST